MENQMLGSKGLIKKHEFVRIIIQCLHSLGYGTSGACLEAESGISCKSSEFESLESQISNANWDDCLGSLNKLNGLSDETRASALFLVFEQSMLECLSRGENSSALEILRKQISGLQVSKEKVHKLAVGLVSLRELGLSKIDYGVIQELQRRLLVELEKLLPPPITLPERRLEHLVEMATSAQIDNCMYHTSDMMSLYADHHCNRDDFPTETIQILTNHNNEVWFVQFSNNGEFLASSSRDCTAIIWKVLENGKVMQKHTLKSHQSAVSFVAWSPDDSMLLTCGNVEVLKLWDVETALILKKAFSCGTVKAMK